MKLDLGVIQSHDGVWIDGYEEKPLLHYTISAGVYVFEPAILDYISYENFSNPLRQGVRAILEVAKVTPTLVQCLLKNQEGKRPCYDLVRGSEMTSGVYARTLSG